MSREIETLEYPFTAMVLDDGKVTIPKTLRDRFKIRKGDLVTLVIKIPRREVRVRDESDSPGE